MAVSNIEMSEIVDGLSAAQKQISPKYFYDERGSQLFDEITRLPEYYLTNTELGVLMSVFGFTSMIAYFPGGWLADRVSPRKLMTTSLIVTGLAGLYFATFPTYTVSIAIHAFWGVSITLLFWGAMIRVTRNWAPADQQGRAFGWLESLRGVGEVVTSSALLMVFA